MYICTYVHVHTRFLSIIVVSATEFQKDGYKDTYICTLYLSVLCHSVYIIELAANG